MKYHIVQILEWSTFQLYAKYHARLSEAPVPQIQKTPASCHTTFFVGARTGNVPRFPRFHVSRKCGGPDNTNKKLQHKQKSTTQTKNHNTNKKVQRKQKKYNANKKTQHKQKSTTQTKWYNANKTQPGAGLTGREDLGRSSTELQDGKRLGRGRN